MKKSCTTFLGSLVALFFCFNPLLAQIAIIGDYGDDSSGEENVAQLVRGWDTTFGLDGVITVGDNNYSDGEYSTIQDNIGDYYFQFLLEPDCTSGSCESCEDELNNDGPCTWSRVNRFWPAPGNHDWNTTTGNPPLPTPYLDYFEFLNNPAFNYVVNGQPSNGLFYELQIGDIHLFSLDSDSDEPLGTSIGDDQYDWFVDQISQSTAKWKVVYFHHPPYSSEDANNPSKPGRQYKFSSDMRWDFECLGADIVLSGHAHSYERFQKGGIPYVVNGVGGKGPRDFYPEHLEDMNDPAIGNIGDLETIFRYTNFCGESDEQVNGAMLMTSSSNSLNFQFINTLGEVIDAFEVKERETFCPPTGEITTCITIDAEQDDAEERDNGDMDLDSNDLDFGDKSIGLRFATGIPAEAIIEEAYIRLTTQDSNDPSSGSSAPIMEIRGELSAGLTFQNSPSNISNRLGLTTAPITWDTGDWWSADCQFAQGVSSTTPNLKEITQAMVDGGNYDEDHLVFIFTKMNGNGNIEARSKDDSDGFGAPELCIRYRLTRPPSSVLTLECLDDIAITIPAGTAPTVVTWDTPNYNTTCVPNTVSFSSNLSSGNAFPLGTTVVTYGAEDECENRRECSFTVTVSETPPPTESGCNELSFDDFENGYGNWVDGGSDCGRVQSNASSGTFSVRLRDDNGAQSAVSTNVNFVGASQVQIDFTFLTTDMEAGDQFVLEVSDNNGNTYSVYQSWTFDDDFLNETREFVCLLIDDIAFTIDTRFRFRSIAPGHKHEAHFDDIRIAACQCSELISDDFENGYGNWIDGGSECDRVQSNAFSGFGIRLQDDNGVASSMTTNSSVNFASSTQVHMSFTYLTTDMVAGDQFVLEIIDPVATSSTIHTTWTFGTDFINDIREFVCLDINSSTFTGSTQLRLRSIATGRNHEVHLDNIVLNSCATDHSPPCDELISDDFESETEYGNWKDGGSNCGRVQANAYMSDFCVRLRDFTQTSLMYTDLDLMGINEVQLDFTYVTAGMVEGDQFVLELSGDGGANYTTYETWVFGTDFLNGTRQFVSLPINSFPLSALSTIRFRLRNEASGQSHAVFIDDVVIADCRDEEPAKGRSQNENEAINSEAIKIFPVPASESFFIDLSPLQNKAGEVVIYNLQGQQVLINTFDADHPDLLEIQIPKLSNNVYAVSIKSGQKIFSVQKLIVLH